VPSAGGRKEEVALRSGRMGRGKKTVPPPEKRGKRKRLGRARFLGGKKKEMWVKANCARKKGRSLWRPLYKSVQSPSSSEKKRGKRRLIREVAISFYLLIFKREVPAFRK